jgi:hypothetical protein
VQRCEFSAILYSLLRSGLLASLLLAGCASSPKVSVEDQVGNRALQWADALIKLDYDKALTFMTPSYRSSPRVQQFRSDFSGSGFWQDAEIKWVKCDEDNVALENTSDANLSRANADFSEGTGDSGSAEGCVVNVWNDCGKSFAGPIDGSTTASLYSDRCEVRLVLTIMKPPEMSYPMPIPYEMTWLNVDGRWYIYR